MSLQSMVTIIAPISSAQVKTLQAEIDVKLGNPACETFCKAVETAPQPDDKPLLHFASLHALAGSDGKRGHLILEFSADGDEDFVIAELAKRAGELLRPIFSAASDWRQGQDLLTYWKAHKLKIGFGLFDTAGLAFCGTPGQSVAAIVSERELAVEVGRLLAERDNAGSPLRRLKEVRDAIKNSDHFRWAIEVPAPPIHSLQKDPSTVSKVVQLAPSFLTTFLWPPLFILLPLCIWLVWPSQEWHSIPSFKPALALVAGTLSLLALLTALTLGIAYLCFAGQEARDFVSDRVPDPDELKKMVARENQIGFSQNHMLSHTVMKPGLLRKLTIRIAFWAIAKLTALNPRPGHLGEIGTIHFARWLTVPGTRDFLFFSNFGGSWESYLEDFITRAHAGLTAVWSNTVGFPRSRNLFGDGATDGERFKRFARSSMIHTPFWYCAYPGLTTANIRTNSLIRRGLAAAMTEAEAVQWLSNFGSAPRPLAKLETTQIQSLIFGGMGFKPEGKLLAIDLGDDIANNCRWLRAVLPDVAFNDGRYMTQRALISLAAGAGGLAKLGLDPEALQTFPAAFLHGMHGEGRERILGDLDSNRRECWAWGQEGNDVVLLIYGDLTAAGQERPIDALEQKLEKLTLECGGRIAHRVELTQVGEKLSDRVEPFGFVDGVSQPAMRGTYRGLRNDDPIHLVEPGEFVLGYPDNRGNVPPGPSMDAQRDPALRLPVAGSAQGFAEAVAENPRLVGYNGSFLVIRQLEQHAEKFKEYCQTEGARLATAFPDLPLVTNREPMAAYIGAKMIGRWQDGSSLVRNPYMSASKLKQLTGQDPNAKTSRPKSNPANPTASSIDPADVRPEPATINTQASHGDTTPFPSIKPDNDFLFGTEDPQGVRCPYGAHIRRANPRESLSPGSNDQVDISNRHRIIRVGRGYLGADGNTQGLMFMCLNGDIERQFEFIQQTWMGSTKFHGLDAEADPIAGRGLSGGDGFTLPTRRGPLGLKSLPQFVTVRGGGYFFLPGRQLLDFLANP